MEREKTTVERAFELARGAACHNMTDIREALANENYASAAAHLSSPSLRKQLMALLAEHKK
jgi:hypothetical protein